MRLSLLLITAILIMSFLSGCMGAFLSDCPEDGISIEKPSSQTENTDPPLLDSDILRPDPYNISTFRLSETEQSALQTLNGIRGSFELPELVTDETLCALAYIRAKEAYLRFAHTRPDGQNYDVIFAEYGYEVLDSAEVLLSADTPMSMEEFFSVWDDNPEIAQRLINPSFVRVGIGFYHKDGCDIMACLLVN